MRQRWSTARRARRSAFAGLALVVGLALLASACSGPTPQTAFNPRSEYANEGLDLFVLIIWIGVIIGVLVEGVLI
jgi:heme/copper-type cytochrome/quinol oxidase subunit 2